MGASKMPHVPAKVHDDFFRQILADPGRADVFLRWMVRDEVAPFLDEEPAEVLPPDFVGENFAPTRCVVLFRAKLKGGSDVYFIVIREHEASNDASLLLDITEYKNETWKRIIALDPSKLRALPPIFPLVFYHGQEPWTLPGSLDEFIDFGDLPRAAFPSSSIADWAGSVALQ